MFHGISGIRLYEFYRQGKLSATVALTSANPISLFVQVPRQWATCDYSTDASCGDWYTGELHWIAITTCTGFCVGLLRWAFEYPENMPGIFQEITSCHVDPKWSPLTYLLSAISLGGGAALGPEQALVSALRPLVVCGRTDR